MKGKGKPRYRKTRYQMLKEGGNDGIGNVVHSTCWVLKGCHGFFGNRYFGSDDSLSTIIAHIERKYPTKTFEIVPIEYKRGFKPKSLTSIIVEECFF